MRGLTHRWEFRCDKPASARGSGKSLVDRILAARGLDDSADAARFCAPTLRDMHVPSLLPGADEAAGRLLAAAAAGRSIVIYGDYDVDGVSAIAILHHTLRAIEPTARVSWFVPHRVDDGYGLSAEALRSLRAGGADVVVSVDCGITALEPAGVAREIGLELIITDHHGLPPTGLGLPEAAAIVHPALGGGTYPFADLCGAGVAFKVAWRMATLAAGSERVGASMQQLLMNLLAFVALGTIADVVPLVGENRVLTSFGLRLIKRTPFVGLNALIEATNLSDAKIDCERVGFVLGPHLNACGRMGHAADAVRLFTTDDHAEAAAIARSLASMNDDRRRTERAIFESAVRKAEDAGMTSPDRRIIVLADSSWHPGVIGIVCSRLVERFGRPAILLNRQREVCKGSARSVEGYSILRALEACAADLTAYGGHDMAAGLTINNERLDAFVEAITAHANEHIPVAHLTPSLRIDCDADLAELTLGEVRALRQLGPFGRGNPRPLLRIANLVVSGAPRQMGSEGRHLSIQVSDPRIGRSGMMRAVWWKRAEHAAALAAGCHVDLAAEPKINEWNGRVAVELDIRDARIVGPVPPPTRRVGAVEARL
jgi:single-stranded-DNA-specific exonuclease